MTSAERIHLSVPHMSGLEQAYVQDAFASNWLTTVGKNIDGFEAEVSLLLDNIATLAVSSGTAALHLIMRELGVGPGDRVAVSTLTFAGSVWPIVYQGATPVFIDSEDESGNIDPALVEEYLRAAALRNELPAALIVVHLFGQHADLDRLHQLCTEYGVVLVEDAAESLGATYRGRQTGTTADYSILSFNGNKMITTTGGGMVLARDSAAIARMRKWATQAREPGVEYVHTTVGYNYRMSNVLAGIGRGQLQVLSDRVAARRAVAARYGLAFADLDGVELQAEASWGVHSRWLSVIYLDRREHQIEIAEICRRLNDENIEVRPVWRPMHTQPIFREAERVGGHISETLFERGLCLPSSSSLTPESQDRVIDALRHVLQPSKGGHVLAFRGTYIAETAKTGYPLAS